MAKKKVEEKSKPVKTSDETFTWIDKKVQDSISNTSTWASNQLKWNKLRTRYKKPKTFPFIGCANVRMPTAETKMRKLKAALVNVIFGIRPVAAVTPPPSGRLEVAMKIEKWLDNLIMNVINLAPIATIAIDQELEKGFYLLKPYWRTEITTRIETYSLKDLSMQEAQQLFDENTTSDQIKQALIERLEVDMSDLVAEDNEKEIDRVVDEVLQGTAEIKCELQDVLYNAPDVALCNPEKVYVNTDSGFNPQKCQIITHEFYLPLNQVQANVKFKNWSKSSYDEIADHLVDSEAKMKGLTKSLTETQKELREGIDSLNNASNLVKIWETYCWYDLNNDGVEEKCVITTAPDFKKTLRKISLPFDNGKFPFVKIFFELTDDRWFSHRGIPEILEDIIKEIDMQHCQKLDSQTIRNAPMFVYRAGMINPKLVQFMPNQGIPVNGMQPLRDSIDILNNSNPNVEFSYEREQMLLESKIEELIGQVDFTLQSMINKRQPRTLGEVQMQQQNMQQVFSLDASQHTNAFSELFSWIWDLWCQYGNDEEEFAYFGQNGWEKIRLTREEIQGKYRPVVRGNDQNTNPQVKLQKAQQIIQAAMNPVFLQTGAITPIQIVNSLKRFYQTLDIENYEELINLQPQQPPPPPDPALAIQPKFSDLADGEAAQVLMKHGVKPDIQGRAMKSSAKVQDKLQDRQEHALKMGIDFSKLLDKSTDVGGNGG